MRSPERRLARALILAALSAVPLFSPASASNSIATVDVGYGKTTNWDVKGSPELGAMQGTIRAVLDRVHVSYRGIDGDTIEGFYPGANYNYSHIPGWTPFRLYARDTATIAPMARYYFGESALRAPVEEFLRQQYPDGAISATIAPDFETDKATVVSDEETSLIVAAVEAYVSAPDPGWLRKPLRGQQVIQRLNRAMAWVLAFRGDPGTGLIKRAHTTDWGDVKWEVAMVPTDISPGDQWTLSIYDQAIAYAALRGLVQLNMAVGESLEAQRWEAEAEALRLATNATLWQDEPSRGYYRIHRHLEPDQVPHDFDEGEIVAIGNAAALYYGLADANRARRIVAALERARLAAGAPKPGLTLEPAYRGWFESQMDPRVYQNGAIWDWWGGRQVTGEFSAGERRIATEHLMAIARDWSEHPGEIREWESPWLNRVGRDTAYAGAASVVGEAIVEGLFGVEVLGREVRLQPRLGQQDGRVRVYVPASDVYVAYAYEWTASRVSIRYGSNTPHALSVRLPILWTGDVTGWLDGKDLLPVAATQEGDDRIAAVMVPNGQHTIELRRVAPSAAHPE